MGVSANDHIDSPLRFEQRSELFILLKAYVSQKHRKINIHGLIAVDNSPGLPRRIFNVHEGTEQHILFRACHYLLCKKPDEKDMHSTDLQYCMRPKQPCTGGFDIDVRIDNRKACAFL